MDIKIMNQRIIDFQARANEFFRDKGKPELQFHYSGDWITGNLQQCSLLLISLNPGYGDEWSQRNVGAPSLQEEPTSIKYISEFKQGKKLAKGIVHIVLNGKVEQLQHCAETYVYSPFASPDIKILNASLNGLDQELWNAHDSIRKDMVRYAIDQCRPRHIVFIGIETHNFFAKRFPDLLPPGGSDWEKFPLGNKRLFLSGITPQGHGLMACPHLSSTWLSKAEMEFLRERFSQELSSLSAVEEGS